MQYVPPYSPFFQMPYQQPGYYVQPFQGGNPQMGMVPYMYSPEVQQQMYQNQMKYYPGTMFPMQARPEQSDTGDEKKGSEDGSSTSPSDPGATTPTGPIIPKTLVNGIVVCNKPLDIIQQNEVNLPEGPYLSLVVECVATGLKHTDRAVAHVALVDEQQKVILNIYIKPTEPVQSYLKLITKLDERTINEFGLNVEDAMRLIQQTISPNHVLVGHNIARHIRRLKLEKGTHFRDSLDLGECWRVWNPNFNNYTKFSLNHEGQVLVNNRSSGLVPNDAILQMQILQKYIEERVDPQKMLARRRQLMDVPIEKARHKRFPEIEKVCMGVHNKCVCGAPFEDWSERTEQKSE